MTLTLVVELMDIRNKIPLHFFLDHVVLMEIMFYGVSLRGTII